MNDALITTKPFVFDALGRGLVGCSLGQTHHKRDYWTDATT